MSSRSLVCLCPGILDQQAALQWVYRYIQYFGGNSSITIQGEEAGSEPPSPLFAPIVQMNVRRARQGTYAARRRRPPCREQSGSRAFNDRGCTLGWGTPSQCRLWSRVHGYQGHELELWRASWLRSDSVVLAWMPVFCRCHLREHPHGVAAIMALLHWRHPAQSGRHQALFPE